MFDKQEDACDGLNWALNGTCLRTFCLIEMLFFVYQIALNYIFVENRQFDWKSEIAYTNMECIFLARNNVFV